MVEPPISLESFLGLVIRHFNAGLHERARLLCEQAAAAYPSQPAVLQLLAVISLQEGEVAQASRHAEASLALRPDHSPTQRVAADAWFRVALLRQDLLDLGGAEQALRRVLELNPERADAETNLGIVLQERGRIDDAMRAYGRAYRLREDSFGRIAHALAAAPVGRLWLDLGALQDELRNTPR